MCQHTVSGVPCSPACNNIVAQKLTKQVDFRFESGFTFALESPLSSTLGRLLNKQLEGMVVKSVPTIQNLSLNIKNPLNAQTTLCGMTSLLARLTKMHLTSVTDIPQAMFTGPAHVDRVASHIIVLPQSLPLQGYNNTKGVTL